MTDRVMPPDVVRPRTSLRPSARRAQEFRTLDQLVEQIARLWVLGLPMAELQRLADETPRITLAAVNQAAQTYAVPGEATLLLIGDYAKIGPGLSELDLGEVTVLDVEGQPARR